MGAEWVQNVCAVLTLVLNVKKILLKSEGLTRDYSLGIVPRFLNLLVVPENKRKFIVFSFRPIDSIVFWNLRCMISLLIDPFSLNVGAMDY